jgi:hypothetical protein
MQSSDFSDFPNPFAAVKVRQPRPRKAALFRATRFLIMVAVCFAIVLGFSIGSKRYLLYRLTADFDSQSPAEQQHRVIQLAQLGPAALGTLVETMLCENLDVARTAYDQILGLQNEWTVLPMPTRRVRHDQMVAAIESIAVRLPDDRTGWAATLLQQTIAEFVGASDARSRDLYARTNQTLDMLTLADRGGPSVLTDQPIDPAQPQRLRVAPSPLPVAASNADWVQWPPTETPTPSIYKSAAAKLQAVAPEEAVVLRPVESEQVDSQSIATANMPASPSMSPSKPATVETSFQIQPVQATQAITDSPMSAYDDASVLRWLSSGHAALREKATLELMSRGYSDRELSLAGRIAGADVATRCELVDLIAREPSIDPRPWLFMLSRDEHREVRLRVASVIATMDDPEARDFLQTWMIEETDPSVAARIRRSRK